LVGSYPAARARIAGLCAQRAITGADLELALDHVEDLLDLAVDVVARLNPGATVKRSAKRADAECSYGPADQESVCYRHGRNSA